MKRILFFLIFLQAVAFGFAQNKTRVVSVYTINKDTLAQAQKKYCSTVKVNGKYKNYNYAKFYESVKNYAIPVSPTELTYLYSFVDNSQREKFQKKYLQTDSVEGTILLCNDDDISKSDYVTREPISVSGRVEIDAPDGAVFLAPIYELLGLKVDKCFDLGENGYGIENGKELKVFIASFQASREAETSALPPIMHDPVPPPANNFYIHWVYPYPIEAETANPNVRIGLRPFAIEYESGGVFKLIPPKVVDGANYRIYQRQRMGQNIRKNDPMGEWLDTTLLVYYGKSDTVMMKDVIGKKAPGKHYTIDMEVYEMSHDGIFSKRRFQVFDGRERLPLKYLDFDINKTNINASYYEKYGIDETKSDHQDSQLPFEVGKWTLNLNDEECQRKLKEVNDFVEDIANREGVYKYSYEIEGFASPEGNINQNKDLAAKRAAFLLEQIDNKRRKYAKVKSQVTVQPWTVVADSLEQAGYTLEAQSVREICAATPNDMSTQQKMIAALPIYSEVIYPKILPLLRISRIEASFTINKVLDSSEVVARYHNVPEYYHSGKPFDYEYYHLMKYLRDDFEKLEPVAEIAYKYDDISKFIGGKEAIDRKWTFAAYNLARCKIHNREYDAAIKLLRPYVRDSLGPVDYNLRFGFRGSFSKPPVNDPAVCLLLIDALSASGEYTEARNYVRNTLDMQRFKIVDQFLDVMEDPNRLYKDAVLRNAMATTSKWNSLIVNAAFCGEKRYPVLRKMCVDSALIISKSDTTIFRDDDPRVHYIRARLLFDQIYQDNSKKYSLPLCNEAKTYADEFSQVELSIRNSMASELLKTFMLDESFLYDEMRWDGYFPYGLYLKAKEVWENNDPTKLKLHPSDAEFVKKYAKPHQPKTEAKKEK